jgi:membrane protein
MTESGERRWWVATRPRHVGRLRIAWLSNFFEHRCTQLAAMIAYYALLSFVPLLFVLVSLLVFVNRQDASSTLVRGLHQALPGQSVDDIVAVVNDLRGHASTLGLIGVAGLAWSALGLLSAITSALNIIYEVPNRPFFRHKARVALVAAVFVAALLISLIVVTAVDAWTRGGASLLGLLTPQQALSLLFSSLVTAGFLFVVYHYLPDTALTVREVMPGVVVATVAFQASFQALPVYLRLVDTVPSVKALGGLAVLLIWFYLMGNLLLVGAELNWWYGRGRYADHDRSRPRSDALAAPPGADE